MASVNGIKNKLLYLVLWLCAKIDVTYFYGNKIKVVITSGYIDGLAERVVLPAQVSPGIFRGGKSKIFGN